MPRELPWERPGPVGLISGALSATLSAALSADMRRASPSWRRGRSVAVPLDTRRGCPRLNSPTYVDIGVAIRGQSAVTEETTNWFLQMPVTSAANGGHDPLAYGADKGRGS